jgi:hypothetical protein
MDPLCQEASPDVGAAQEYEAGEVSPRKVSEPETRACALRCKVDALTSAARVENASISANNATKAGGHG